MGSHKQNINKMLLKEMPTPKFNKQQRTKDVSFANQKPPAQVCCVVCQMHCAVRMCMPLCVHLVNNAFSPPRRARPLLFGFLFGILFTGRELLQGTGEDEHNGPEKMATLNNP